MRRWVIGIVAAAILGAVAAVVACELIVRRVDEGAVARVR